MRSTVPTCGITARHTSCGKVMLSRASVSHSVEGLVGIAGPISFRGYLWYQVPSGGGWICPGGVSKGWVCLGGFPGGMSRGYPGGGVGMSRGVSRGYPTYPEYI